VSSAASPGRPRTGERGVVASSRCRTGARGVALEQHDVARSPLHTASPSTSAASTSTSAASSPSSRMAQRGSPCAPPTRLLLKNTTTHAEGEEVVGSPAAAITLGFSSNDRGRRVATSSPPRFPVQGRNWVRLRSFGGGRWCGLVSLSRARRGRGDYPCVVYRILLDGIRDWRKPHFLKYLDNHLSVGRLVASNPETDATHFDRIRFL
ncbi:hypothetical protein Taro_054215, partial [Colocasia esculenta]|nr:hypothetical protein [Colocasia esculenta]